METLIPNPRAPFLLYMCPCCSLLFAGRGLSLQLCPSCTDDIILSLTIDQSPHLLSRAQGYCSRCHLVLTPDTIDTPCLVNEPLHLITPIPPEAFECPSAQALKDASKLQSVGSDSDSQTSLLSLLPQEASTTPSTTDQSLNPDSLTNPTTETGS